MSLPLKGIKILDCSALLPGPFCTMMLSELGADVIKVEKAGTGDFMSLVSPFFYNYLNGNKKLITLNLKQKQGVEILLKLAETSDVFVEGFRPGVVKRLGIDFDSIKKVNPSIIYCSLSGYGQSGPLKDMPGHDINYQAVAGLFSISGDPDAGPVFPSGIQTADIAGSMFALSAILASLHKPKNSPAQLLDVSLTESMAMWMLPRFMEYIDRNNPPKEILMGRGPYGIFKTSDGKYLSLGIVEDHFWNNFCKLLGFNDWASDKSLSGWITRNDKREMIVPRLKDAICKKDLNYWLTECAKHDIPAAPVNDFTNWMDDPQLKHRKFIPTTADGSIDENNFRRFPVNFSTQKRENIEKKANLGRDNETIFAHLGINAAEIDKLKKNKTI